MRESLYRYGTEELSLRVFNEFDLYQIRHSKALYRAIDERFQYTKAQLSELKEDLKSDLEEMKRFEQSQIEKG